MRTIQQNLISMVKEHTARKHLAVVVCMIAIATAFAVFWSLRISGITLANAEPTCGLEEHTHTDACYDWVATETDGTEAVEETEVTETGEETELTETGNGTDEGTVSVAGTKDSEAAAADTEVGTESVTEAMAEAGTEEATEELTEEETETPQPGDTKVVDGVTYVYELICEMEEHTHTDECYENDENDSTAEEADADEVDAAGLTAGVANIASYGVSAASLDDDASAITTASDEESDTTDTSDTSDTTVTASNDDASDYYLAATVNGIPSDGSYIIYTYDETNGVYYVVNTNGTLSKCTEISSASAATGAGPYYVTNTETIVYGSDGESAYEAAQWTVSQDSSDSDAYTIVGADGTSYLAASGTSDDEVMSTTALDNSYRTGQLTFTGDFALTYTFYNKGSGTNNWENFVLEMVTGTTYLDVRADNYGFVNGSNGYSVSSGTVTTDWTAWNSAMQSGQLCSVTVKRTGTTVVVTTTAYGETFTTTATVSEFTADAELTVYLTGQNCTLSDVLYSYTTSSDTPGSDLDANVTTLVSSDSGYVTFSSSSGGVTISRGDICAVVTDATSESNTTAAWKAYGTASTFYFAEVQETADNYNFADTVTLADAAEKQDDSYVVYTKIDDTYYIVSAVNGSLIECTDISTYTNEDDKVLLSSAAGVYIWSFNETTNEPQFKFTTGTDDRGVDDFEDYYWTISSDEVSNDGSGDYKFYNSSSSTYLAPSLDTVSETIASTTQSVETQPSIGGYGTIVYTVSVDSNISGQIQLNIVESGYTSGNSGGHRVQVRIQSGGLSIAESSSKYTSYCILGNLTSCSRGDVLTVSVTTFSGGFYLNCHNETNGQTGMIYVKTTLDFSGGALMYVWTNSTTATVSAVTAGYSGTTAYGTATTISGSSYGLTEKAKVGGDGIAWPTFPGATAASKDFDVTYTFSNTTTENGTDNATLADSFSVHLGNASSDETASIDISFESQTSSGSNAVAWTTATDPSSDNGYSEDDVLSALKDASGADCTVRVIRTGNHFFFILSVTGNSVTYTMYAETTADGFEDCDTYIYLMGQNCTIGNISYYDNTTRDYNEKDYVRVSKMMETITLSASVSGDAYKWSATATGAYSESFSLIAQLATDTANTAEIEWVSDASASAAASGTATTTLSNESVTSLSDKVVTTFSLARVTECVVWFDGTNGGMTPYTGATETKKATTSNAAGTEFTVTAPTESEVANTRYINYTLRGWYDIYNNEYYAPGSEITVDSSTVLYADWKVNSYDIGVADDKDADENDQHVVNTVSTNSFITTQLFDINDIFDVYSVELVENEGIETSRSGQAQTLYTTLSASSHSEVFRSVGTNTTALTGLNSLNFLFFRSEAFPYYYYDNESNYTYVNLNNYLLDYAANRSGQNTSLDRGTTGILETYDTDDSGNTLLQMLYDTGNTADDVSDVSSDSFVYGKTYVGAADYLFQYNSTTGYYYYNSALNAASYNQSEGRFYVYDYVVAVNSGSSTSDFLPYNYVTYDKSYTYGEENDSNNLSNYKISTNNANYWFGMSTEISFYLANDVPDGSTDTDYGKVNLSIDSTDENQYHTTFKFSGDDDVWVFIDGKLALDLGGVHGRIFGEIDFSTGEVSVGYDGDSIYVTENRSVLDYNGEMTVQEELSKVVQSLEAGAHTLTFYYLERGSGESNAAIYFNIASATYNLELSKVDEDGDTSLTGAEFTFYTDSGFEEEAEDLENKDGEEKSTFSSSETVYGLKEGTLYYVVETASPDGYTAAGKYFTVILKENVLTITVYDSSDTAQELYIYTITYDSTTSETTVKCTVTENTDAEEEESVTNSSGWKYVLADENNLSVSAVITSGAVSYYNIGFKIANTKEYELPATGSMGILPYRRAGTVFALVSITGLLITAFYHLVRVRKLRMRVSNKGYTKKKRKRGNHFARTRDHPRERSEIHG